ncbi:MAG: WD40 repeat domain-containing protein [Deltaproteobacteria bacterium]|nr:MAG: WD40 repeat domain-containing protein [Deltaproteobacteria bacterium]
MVRARQPSTTLFALGQFTFQDQQLLEQGVLELEKRLETRLKQTGSVLLEDCTAWIRIQAENIQEPKLVEEALRGLSELASAGHVDLRLDSHPQLRRLLPGGTRQSLAMPALVSRPFVIAAQLLFEDADSCSQALHDFTRRCRFPVFQEQGWSEFQLQESLWRVEGRRASLHVQLSIRDDLYDGLLALLQSLAYEARSGRLDCGTPQRYLRWNIEDGHLQRIQEGLSPMDFASHVRTLERATPLSPWLQESVSSEPSDALGSVDGEWVESLVFSGAVGQPRGCLELDEERLVSWTSQSMQLWDKSSGRLLHQQRLSFWSIAGMRKLPDGRLVAWHELDGTVHLWDPDTLVTSAFEAHEHTVCNVQVMNPTTLLSHSLDGTVKVWEFPSLRLLQTLDEFPEPVRQVAPLPASRLLLSSPPYGDSVEVWDLKKGCRVWKTQANQAWPHPSGYLVTESMGTFRVWSPQWSCVAEWSLASGPAHDVLCLPDEQLLIHPLGSPELWVVSLLSGNVLHRWSPHRDPLLRVVPLLQQRYLTLTQEHIFPEQSDTTVKIWREDGWELCLSLDAKEPVRQVMELPGDRLLVVLEREGAGHSMQIFDLSDGALLSTLEGHEEPVVGVGMLQDGRLISWSQDTTLRMWG